MSRFRVFARVGRRSSAGVGACRLSVGASNSSSFFTCYHRYRGVHNMKTKPFIESSNLPSVASGFPRPGGNDGPGHFSGATVAAVPALTVAAADGRHARRPLSGRPASFAALPAVAGAAFLAVALALPPVAQGAVFTTHTAAHNHILSLGNGAQPQVTAATGTVTQQQLLRTVQAFGSNTAGFGGSVADAGLGRGRCPRCICAAWRTATSA